MPSTRIHDCISSIQSQSCSIVTSPSLTLSSCSIVTSLSLTLSQPCSIVTSPFLPQFPLLHIPSARISPSLDRAAVVLPQPRSTTSAGIAVRHLCVTRLVFFYPDLSGLNLPGHGVVLDLIYFFKTINGLLLVWMIATAFVCGESGIVVWFYWC